MRLARATALSVGLLLISLVAGIAVTSAVVPGASGRIAYVGFDEETGNTDIYTMNPDGSDIQQVTTDGQPKGSPRWSPDGTKIVFDVSSIVDGDTCCGQNIYVIDADGTNLQRLTDTPDHMEGRNNAPTWSPDGSWVVFVSSRGDAGGFEGDRELYRMNADGSGETQLTFNDGRTSDEDPSISPDGTRIAFASNRDDTLYGTFDIYVMEIASSNVTRLTFNGSYAYPLPKGSRKPVWSPDGSRIAYETTKDGNFEAWVMDADGRNQVNVSNYAGYDADPTWSPDGTQILYTSLRDGQYDLWAVDAAPAQAADIVRSVVAAVAPMTVSAASGPRNLTAGTDSDAQSPDWQRIAPVDKTKPSITLSSPTATTYTLRQRVLADYACVDEDGGSGLVSCTGKVADGLAIATGSVGTKSFLVTAEDETGNVRRKQVRYTVAYGICTAFDETRAYQRWKTVTIALRLCDATGRNVSSAAIPLRVVGLTPGPLPVGVASAFTHTTNNSTTDQYTWQLPLRGLPAGEHVLSFTAGNDPTVHTLRITVAAGTK